MNIAISNIGWDMSEEADVAKTLQQLGIKHVEIAPTKVWEDPTSVTDAQITEYADFWKQHGITIVAFQSIMFGKNDLTIFDDAETRDKTRAHLTKMIELAGRMNVKILVFGSPKNRRVPEGMSKADAEKVGAEFFGALGDVATQNNATFCIEPNAKGYECNFVTTASEGRDFVDSVTNKGFGLHLDAGNMTMEHDDPQEIVKAKDILRHFHISSPYLGDIEEKEVDHKAMGEALKSIDYASFTSIEMRPAETGQNVERVKNAIAIAQKYYS